MEDVVGTVRAFDGLALSRGVKRLDIAVPPKYAPKDFRKNSYWSQRGKLDVPKERFISYPGASPEGNPAEEFGTFLEEQLRSYELSEQDLKGWRPPPKGRGRKSA